MIRGAVDGVLFPTLVEGKLHEAEVRDLRMVAEEMREGVY